MIGRLLRTRIGKRAATGRGMTAPALALALACLASGPMPSRAAARPQQEKRDYLSQNEADAVRDAFNTDERIHLFIGFASDRMKKLQYEIDHPGDNIHPEERINNLIIGFSDCLDDASDLIDEGVDHQEDIRKSVQEMQSRATDFLKSLQKLQALGAKMDPFKDNLDDAVESVTDAINTANDAAKELAPPPVRRVPQ